MIASPLVNLIFYSTQTSSSLAKAEFATTPPSELAEAPTIGSAKEGDVEKHVAGVTSTGSLSSITSMDVRLGRPDVVKIIDDAVAQADPKDRIAVAVCGPEGLMKVARQTVARNIKPEGPSLELQCEEYSW